MKEGDIDRYLQESSKSYKECKVKNSARRSSLQKKTLGIDMEKKMLSAQLSREEKQLREQLRHMQIDKMKHSMIHDMRAKAKASKTVHEENEEDEHLKIPIEPYPVTLTDSPDASPKPRRRAMTVDEKGLLYARRKSRRQSKEFEDLSMDTETGKLRKPENIAKRLLSARSSKSKMSSSASNSPRSSPTCSKGHFISPSLRRKQLETSDGSSSNSNMSSLEELHWIGSPEATKSVRRSKKTTEEQEFSSELHRLSKNMKT